MGTNIDTVHNASLAGHEASFTLGASQRALRRDGRHPTRGVTWQQQVSMVGHVQQRNTGRVQCELGLNWRKNKVTKTECNEQTVGEMCFLGGSTIQSMGPPQAVQK